MNPPLQPLTPEALIGLLRDLAARGIAVVARETLEFHLRAEQRYEWGDPHGWRIREAEDAEARLAQPRFWRWQREDGETTRLAYTLAGITADGWQRSRP